MASSPSPEISRPLSPAELKPTRQDLMQLVTDRISIYNQRKAARMFQTHRATLARKLKKYDLK